MTTPTSLPPQTLPPLPPGQQSLTLEAEEAERDKAERESVKKYHERGKSMDIRKRMAATRCDSMSVQDAIDREYGDATELLPQPYEEIKKLIKIERSPICGKALEEWSRKEMLFSDRVQRAKAEVARLKSEIYQFVGYY
jgi:hypothetical protein